MFGWIDSDYALIIPGLANGVVIFLFRQFFSQIPRELVEAARMDGAGWLTILWKIYLPLSKPVIISAGAINLPLSMGIIPLASHLHAI